MTDLVSQAKVIREATHPDIDYLKQESFEAVLSEALLELYRAQPSNPLRFLGNWLVNYVHTSDNLDAQKSLEEEREKLRHHLAQKQANVVEHQRLLEQAQEETLNQETTLRQEFESMQDPELYLGHLACQLQVITQATAVYIGLREQVKKPVTDLDSESAHLDATAPFVVRYIEATQLATQFIGTTLTEQEGEVTFSVWKKEEGAEGSEAPNEKPVFVPDVITDPRIKFFDVPRLGCYLAIPLTYNSCLSEASFDAAVENTLTCCRLRAEREQTLERLAQEAAEAAEKAVEDAENAKAAEGAEKAKVAEAVKPTENAAADRVEEGELEEAKKEQTGVAQVQTTQELPEIKEAPYRTEEVRLVVCMDSLGQDRVFTEEEVKTCCGWVDFFISQWERTERELMQHDVSTFIDQHAVDMRTLAQRELEWAEEEKSAVDQAEAVATDLDKPLAGQAALVEVLKQRLLSEFSGLLMFQDFSVIKHRQVFKVAFLYTGVAKDQIVEPGTNRLKWKLAKCHLNESFKEAIAALNPRGPKPEVVPEYAKPKFLLSELQKISGDAVQKYSLALSLLHRLLIVVFKLRIADVTARRKAHLARKKTRDAAVKAAKDLEAKRKRALDTAMAKHKTQMDKLKASRRKDFNYAEFLSTFNASNPPVEVPPEVMPDEDRDVD